MLRYLAISALLAFSSPAFAQMDHDTMDHSTMNHGEDHVHSEDHVHAETPTSESTAESNLTLASTPDLDAARAAGGEPVVASVLGAVCDFCAMAMNKTFGKRDEVAAVYVDLDAKTLNLVLKPGAELTNETIRKTVKKAGYQVSQISRGDALLVQ